MKKYLFFLLIITGISTNAQVSIYNHNLTDTTQNFLYIGVENNIIISSKGYNEATNLVMISGGGASISKQSANHYIIRASSVTDDCKIWVSEKNGKTVVEKNYKVRLAPEPVAQLGTLRNTEATISQILTNPFITTSFPDCFLKCPYKVVSFRATFVQDTDSLITLTQWNILTNEQIKNTKALVPGDNIYFDNIRANSPDSRTIKLPPFYIKIK
jgi:GldM C-terminal domain